MTKAFTLIACGIVVLLAGYIPTLAQLSDEAFELSQASDLYDERGYGQSSSISVDGNLTVSNSTGVPSYVYPISSHTISGTPINVSLTYAGSVSFTTFTEFFSGTLNGVSDPAYFRWTKFQQNRPAWILGVNGFAIQVLHNAMSFYCNPEAQEDFADQNIDNFSDKDFVWLIDGYNFCNRMLNFHSGGLNSDFGEESAYVDVIRLLRSDGSILELVNSTEYDGQLSQLEGPNLYTGYYAVNEANSQGYAIVEYSDQWPEHVKRAAGLLPGDEDDDFNWLRPRKVRYFPGDGTEYVFVEWLMPYGQDSYNGNNGANAQHYGEPGSTPSIFYLEELRSATGHLTSFKRSRHYSPERMEDEFGPNAKDFEDRTRGRALITSFDGHEIEYLNNGMIINALGRTTKVEFHKVMVSGSEAKEDQHQTAGSSTTDPSDDEYLGNTRLFDYGYLFKQGGRTPSGIAQHYANMPNTSTGPEDARFRSYNGMVTRIIDPVGRVTKFDYNTVKRKFEGFGFPRSGTDVELELSHFQLTGVTEPTAQYDICYRYEDPLTQNLDTYSSCASSPPSVLNIEYWDSNVPNFYLLNDVVNSVTKSFCGETLSKTDYEFTLGMMGSGQYTSGSKVSTFDYAYDDLSMMNVPISLSTTVTSFYQSPYLPNSVPGMPKKRFTGVAVTEQNFKEIVADAQGNLTLGNEIHKERVTNTYPQTPPVPYVVLPSDKVVQVNDVVKSRHHYEYDHGTGPIRHYFDGEGNALTDRDNTFGHVLHEKREILREEVPLGSGTLKDRLVNRTTYLNIPYDPALFTARPCGILKKLETLANYYNQYPDNKDTDPTWEEAMYQTGIASFEDPEAEGTVPPRWGLVQEEAVLDPQSGVPGVGRYLGGKQYEYGTPDEIGPGGAIEGMPTLIGKLLAERQVSEDETDVITTTEYEYEWTAGDDCRLLPARVTNANGAVSEMEYVLVDQDENTPVHDYAQVRILHNDDKVTTYDFAPPLYFSLQFEQPMESSVKVRKVEPSGLTPVEEVLKTYNHATYYGQSEGILDPNGWYTRYGYDANGRIKYAVLPGDVRPAENAPYVGTEEIPIRGRSDYDRKKGQLTCGQNTAAYNPLGDEEFSVFNSLDAYWKTFPTPPMSDCPCPPSSNEKSSEGAHVQEDCTKTIVYTTEEKAVAVLPYAPVSDDPNTPENETSPILLAQSLNDAYLRLVVSGVEGECVLLRISCDRLNLDVMELFGACTEFYDGGDVDVTATDKEKGYDNASIQGGGACESQTEVYEENKGEVLKIPLNTTELLSLSSGDFLEFTFEVLTPNSGISFAQESEDSRPTIVLDGTFTDTKKDDADYTMVVDYDDRHLRSTFTSKIDDFRHTGNSYEPDPYNPGTFNASGDDAFQEPYRRASVRHRFGADYRILETEALLKEWDNSPVSTPSVVSYEYTGGGLTRSVTDQVGNTTETDYDGMGRAVATHMPGVDVFSDVSPVDGVDDNPGVPEEGVVESLFYIDNDDLQSAPSGGLEEYDPTLFGPVDVAGQDYYQGYKEVGVSIDEDGIETLTVSDAFGNTRKQLFDPNNINETPRKVVYEYDIRNRLSKVTNAELQETEYTYDKFGRVKYKTQPDMGTTSFVYDNIGNVRFSQTEQQDNDQELTFYQYDDLNRITAVGVAQFTPDHLPEEVGVKRDADPAKSAGGYGAHLASGGRLTDLLEDEGHFLHLPGYDGQTTDQLTVNPSLWKPVNANPTIQYLIPPNTNWQFSADFGCTIQEGLSQDDTQPKGPYLVNTNILNYDPLPAGSATLDDFEDVALYPNHLRMAIHYDEIPTADQNADGSVWSFFPPYGTWRKLMPLRPDWADENENGSTTDQLRSIRNLKGREAAVAYREHNGEPYHYTVTSYDPRGRVEAVLHYTENIGFDGVYYEYNSMNMITRVRTIDQFRQHTTWYGYDNNGRLDTVISVLSDIGTGYGGNQLQNFPLVNNPRYPNYDEPRPSESWDKPDIVYIYDERGLVETKQYQPGGDVNVDIDYTYNERGWLTEMVASDPLNTLFDMSLEYAQTGQILKQSSQLGTDPVNTDHYDYDPQRQLKKWTRNKGTGNEWKENYLYDLIGNREARTRSGSNSSNIAMDYNKDGCSPNPLDPNYCGDIVAPNQLIHADVYSGAFHKESIAYQYDVNGALAERYTHKFPNNPMPFQKVRETFGNSYRNLVWQYKVEDLLEGLSGTDTTHYEDWRYRYNPRGERESKRLYYSEDDDAVKPYPWVYYLLDGKNRQFSVWHGQQTSDPVLCPAGETPFPPGTRARYMYPVEYLTYGLGRTADMIIDPNTPVKPEKEFKITDHLGSTRVALRATGTTEELDYEPFGTPVAGDAPRKGFIDKEVDKESDLGDYGVRKYDSEMGRFTSIDPLWEEYQGWTPYHYSINNPIFYTDATGKSVEVIDDAANEALQKLNKEYPELGISQDKSGRLSSEYIGPLLPGTIEAAFLDAVYDPNITVQLSATTKSTTFVDQSGTAKVFQVGVYQGAEFSFPRGTLLAKQKVNMDAAFKMEEVGGPAMGRTVMHEIVEAYVGASNNGAHVGDAPNGPLYAKSHNTTMDLDQIYKAGLGNVKFITTRFRDGLGKETGSKVTVQNRTKPSLSRDLFKISIGTSGSKISVYRR